MPALGQFQIEPAEDFERGRHRHEIVERGVGIGVLERGDLRVAIGAVRSDDRPRAGIGNAVGQSFVREPAEHRRVDHAHALGGFGPVDLRHDARHVQGHAVARLQAQRLQRHRALGDLQQQLLAGHREAIERRALAPARRHVPAVAFEDQRGFIAVSGQHMAVQFREGGIGAPAHKPAPVRRGGTVETCVPGREGGRERRRYRCSRYRVPALPATVSPLRQPRAGWTDIGDEPVHVARGYRAVEATGISERGGAHRLPIGAGAHRVGQRFGHACQQSVDRNDLVPPYSQKPRPLSDRKTSWGAIPNAGGDAAKFPRAASMCNKMPRSMHTAITRLPEKGSKPFAARVPLPAADTRGSAT